MYFFICRLLQFLDWAGCLYDQVKSGWNKDPHHWQQCNWQQERRKFVDVSLQGHEAIQSQSWVATGIRASRSVTLVMIDSSIEDGCQQNPKIHYLNCKTWLILMTMSYTTYKLCTEEQVSTSKMCQLAVKIQNCQKSDK